MITPFGTLDLFFFISFVDMYLSIDVQRYTECDGSIDH